MKTYNMFKAGIVCVSLALSLNACGKKSKKEADNTAPRKEVPQTVTPAPQATVTITNKDSLASEVKDGSVTAQLTLAGTNTPEEYTLVCRAGKASEVFNQPFQACNGGNSQTLKNIEDGESYTISAKAIHNESGAQGMIESVTFTVGQKKNMKIEGLDKLQAATSGVFPLQAALDGVSNASWACKVDEQTIPCQSGKLSLNLDSFERGTRKLLITASVSGGGIVAEETIYFCAGMQCDQGQDVDHQISSVGLGNLYSINIPEGMHLLSYATNKTFLNDQVQSLSVLNDPLMPGKNCNDGRTVSLNNGSAGNFLYCEDYYTWDNEYKQSTGFRRALNQIEFSTQADDLAHYERFVFNGFDGRPEDMYSVSRFENLCNYSYHGVNSDWVQAVENYWGAPQWVRIDWCQTSVNARFGQQQDVWVAGFFMERLDGNSASGLEMVYIAGPGVIDSTFNQARFIRKAIERVRGIVESTGLNEAFSGYLGN